jgi:hypothetical protein
MSVDSLQNLHSLHSPWMPTWSRRTRQHTVACGVKSLEHQLVLAAKRALPLSSTSTQHPPTHLDSSLAQVLADSQSRIDRSLDVTLQTSAKVSEHRRSTAQHDVVVQRPSNVDRAVLDHIVDDLRDWCREIGIGELRMEEDLRPEEALVADIDVERLLCHAVDSVVGSDPLRRFRVVFREFLGDVGANVGESLLDCFGSFQALFRRDAHLALTQQTLNE